MIKKNGEKEKHNPNGNSEGTNDGEEPMAWKPTMNKGNCREAIFVLLTIGFALHASVADTVDLPFGWLEGVGHVG